MPVCPHNIPTILIVDDEPFNLEFLELVLKQQGYNIITANSGRKGRMLAEQEQPDLILLDIMMPGENGFECATVLRLSPETSEIPILFLSALDDDANTSKGFDAGAVDFIAKPFAYKEVIQRIRLHLKLMSCDRQLKAERPAVSREKPLEADFPVKGSRAFYPDHPRSSGRFMHESVILTEKSESHLLLNCSEPCPEQLPATIKELLAENSGPLFRPSETLRNIGIGLKNNFSSNNEISAAYIHLDREDESLTVVNAGALPVILLRRDKPPQLIERQSGNLGSLGMGLPPCSTYDIKRGDRVFMFSREMLNSFAREGDAINELMEAFHLSSGVDIETACQAAGEMLLRNGEQPEGILVGIEG
ncbi:response regulator [Maridesulfovibrio salexigens]|uniref:Response regulator receiver protein n=1 Tax=Maridesulfovibrio salexigens (strain ATCC 14822 / DSM 2638 / NCIMB 8403 / VKM B-1763) TaxID=526222 RepID=C6BSJ6_MARSD|nr:response regulator [Maridesulfovibrio salexigens]ACS81452.1 response regulator receiver protein [Maridesulfovibrio salexigens DSM 2638]